MWLHGLGIQPPFWLLHGQGSLTSFLAAWAGKFEAFNTLCVVEEQMVEFLQLPCGHCVRKWDTLLESMPLLNCLILLCFQQLFSLSHNVQGDVEFSLGYLTKLG